MQIAARRITRPYRRSLATLSTYEAAQCCLAPKVSAIQRLSLSLSQHDSITLAIPGRARHQSKKKRSTKEGSCGAKQGGPRGASIGHTHHKQKQKNKPNQRKQKKLDRRTCYANQGAPSPPPQQTNKTHTVHSPLWLLEAGGCSTPSCPNNDPSTIVPNSFTGAAAAWAVHRPRRPHLYARRSLRHIGRAHFSNPLPRHTGQPRAGHHLTNTVLPQPRGGGTDERRQKSDNGDQHKQVRRRVSRVSGNRRCLCLLNNLTVLHCTNTLPRWSPTKKSCTTSACDFSGSEKRPRARAKRSPRASRLSVTAGHNPRTMEKNEMLNTPPPPHFIKRQQPNG